MGPSDGHARARLGGWAFVQAERGLVQMLGIAGATFWLAYDHGGFAIQSRGPFAIGVWWTALFGIAIGVWPFVRASREMLVAGACLAALAAWTLISAAWAPSGETALSEFDLAALYLGIFLLTVVASSRLDAHRWADGIALGIVAVAVLAVASRCFPSVFSSKTAETAALSSRLAYPVGYWNGLAALVALGVPLLLRAALAPRSTLIRALSLAGFPVLGATIYLTSSRGGAAAAALGGTVFLLSTDRRWAALVAAATAAGGAVVAVLVLSQRPEVAAGDADSAAIAQGRSAALLIAAVCVGTAVAYAALLSRGGSIRTPPRWVARIVPIAIVLALLGVFWRAIRSVSSTRSGAHLRRRTTRQQSTRRSTC